MTVQDVTINVNDKSSGLGRSNSRKTIAVLGICSAGTASTVYAHTNKIKLVTDHTGGPAVEATASVLDEAGGTVLLVPVNGSVAGTNGSVTSAGTSPPVITTGGAPKDYINWKIKCITAGALGTSVLQISRDGGVNYDAPITSAATISNYKGTGVDILIAVGSASTDNVWTFESTAPFYSTTDVANAFAALLADPRRWKLAYLTGQAAGATDQNRADAQAALAAAVSSQMTTAAGAKRWSRALIDAPRPVADTSAGDTAWQTALKASTAFGNFIAERVAVSAGDIDQISPVTNLTKRRPLGFEVASRIAKVDLSVDISAFDPAESGPLPARVRKLYHDERVSPGADDARFITARTFPGADAVGFYFTDCPTMALSSSDYARLTACLPIDEASHIAYAAGLKFLSARTEIDATTGFIVESAARSGEQFVASKCRAGLVQKRDCTGIAVAFKRDDDLRIAPPTLNMSVRVFTWVYPKGVTVDLGVTPPSLAFAS